MQAGLVMKFTRKKQEKEEEAMHATFENGEKGDINVVPNYSCFIGHPGKEGPCYF